MVSANLDGGVLVVECNVSGDWSPVLVHAALVESVLPHSDDDTLWDVDGGDFIVHVVWDQVVDSESSVLVVGVALLSSLLAEVLRDASSFVSGDDLGGAVLVVESDVTFKSIMVGVCSTMVDVMLIHGHLNFISDLDGGNDVVPGTTEDTCWE